MDEFEEVGPVSWGTPVVPVKPRREDEEWRDSDTIAGTAPVAKARRATSKHSPEVWGMDGAASGEQGWVPVSGWTPFALSPADAAARFDEWRRSLWAAPPSFKLPADHPDAPTLAAPTALLVPCYVFTVATRTAYRAKLRVGPDPADCDLGGAGESSDSLSSPAETPHVPAPGCAPTCASAAHAGSHDVSLAASFFAALPGKTAGVRAQLAPGARTPGTRVVRTRGRHTGRTRTVVVPAAADARGADDAVGGGVWARDVAAVLASKPPQAVLDAAIAPALEPPSAAALATPAAYAAYLSRFQEYARQHSAGGRDGGGSSSPNPAGGGGGEFVVLQPSAVVAASVMAPECGAVAAWERVWADVVAAEMRITQLALGARGPLAPQLVGGGGEGLTGKALAGLGRALGSATPRAELVAYRCRVRIASAECRLFLVPLFLASYNWDGMSSPIAICGATGEVCVASRPWMGRATMNAVLSLATSVPATVMSLPSALSAAARRQLAGGMAGRTITAPPEGEAGPEAAAAGGAGEEVAPFDDAEGAG